MNLERRPDPDALLAQVEAEERQRALGKLKIFLGYAAGVGKTYSMLEAAHSRKAEGVDVVIAVVETHGRGETKALLMGLERIPLRQIEYRGVRLTEMDLDAVLARKPQLALVDEHAHTNAPGSRHAKRWQDIEELLKAGIDVYTTLNIQHLESFRDIIGQITGVIQRETVPDRVLDEAAEIEVVDLPPEELLLRLREGKVYIPEQAARAMEDFFESGNLIALREITLRRAADRVDEQMRSYLKTYQTPELWPVPERIMVCISGAPGSERLIRTARRLAEETKAEWFALYVETPGDDKLTRENRERIWEELRLAERLGAKEVTTLSADSPVEAVLDYAREHQISRIVAGRPLRPRWREWLHGSFIDQLLRRGQKLDVLVVSNQEEKMKNLTSGLSTLFSHLLDPTNLVMLFLLAVVIAALRLGFGPAVLTAILSVISFDFFFVRPYFSFAVEDTQYLITFGGLMIVGMLISTLVSRARGQAEALKTRENQTNTLYALSRELAAAVDLKEILETVIHHVRGSIKGEVALFLPEGESVRPGATSGNVELSEKEISVALWTCRNGKVAGLGTETLSSSSFLYLPLATGGKALGVLGVKPQNGAAALSPENRRLLEAFANQAALAIERVNLARKAEQTQILQATERLERALLNSISHDLRTPLSSIMGTLSSLREDPSFFKAENQMELLDLALDEANWMNRFVSNLLNMTRLEAGALRIKREPHEVQDLIGSVLTSLEARLKSREVKIQIPSSLPLVNADPVLVAQVIMNLLDNSLKYSPPGTPLEIEAAVSDSWIEIRISDHGPGVPEEHRSQVFEKFFRLPGTEGVRGTGLGLAISKGIIEAHQGKIWVENLPGGGAKFILALPTK
ncbi:MAG: kdpD [Deltaproteobacteria bacterium]|nr:kdpD [Deltaproteobacteria bacterium]